MPLRLGATGGVHVTVWPLILHLSIMMLDQWAVECSCSVMMSNDL